MGKSCKREQGTKRRPRAHNGSTPEAELGRLEESKSILGVRRADLKDERAFLDQERASIDIEIAKLEEAGEEMDTVMVEKAIQATKIVDRCLQINDLIKATNKQLIKVNNKIIKINKKQIVKLERFVAEGFAQVVDSRNSNVCK